MSKLKEILLNSNNVNNDILVTFETMEMTITVGIVV